jgi:hypothetical protein
MKCDNCNKKQFLIEIVHQVNGNDDTYKFICANCGEYVDGGVGLGYDNYGNHLIGEIDRVNIGKDSLCFEKWSEEGVIIYYVSLYNDDDLSESKDFESFADAEECYKECYNVFKSVVLGSRDCKHFDLTANILSS